MNRISPGWEVDEIFVRDFRLVNQHRGSVSHHAENQPPFLPQTMYACQQFIHFIPLFIYLF
jgi:hypothetical protein